MRLAGPFKPRAAEQGELYQNRPPPCDAKDAGETRYLSVLDEAGSVSIAYSDKIGKFDTPSVRPSGYDGAKNWFKSADKYSRMNNGTWTRTEQWTYTDDTTHSWIYES